MSILATALGFGKRAASDFTVTETDLKEQDRKLRLTRATLEMKRNRFDAERKKLTNVETNLKCSPFELSLNLRRAQNQAHLISHLDDYIRFFVRVEAIYQKIIDTRHHITVLKQTNVDPERLAEMQKVLSSAASKIAESEEKLKDLEFRSRQTDDTLSSDNDKTTDAASEEIMKVLEAISICKATGDQQGLKENQEKYEKLMADLC